MTAVISAAKVKSKLYVDNVKAETTYELYENVAVKGEANEDSSNPLNFELSSTGSLPTGIIKSAKNVRVENVYNAITGEYSNVGVLDTIRGSNESLGVTLSKVNTQSCVIFETDIMFKDVQDEHFTQLFFTNEKNQPKDNSAFGLVFKKTGGKIEIKVYANDATTNTVVASGLNIEEWYKLRIEYYPNGDADTRIKIYVNDKLEYVTNKHFTTGKGSAMTNVKSAFFYTFLNSKCSIYVDNMSLTTSDATCNEALGDK